MTPRGVETFIARFTLAALLVYAPAAVWSAWPANPFHLADAAGFALLLWGASASLRARPDAAPGVLCAGYAWTAADGWRALTLRIETLEQGGPVDAGLVWLLAFREVVALIGLALLLLLVVESRAPSKREKPARPTEPMNRAGPTRKDAG